MINNANYISKFPIHEEIVWEMCVSYRVKNFKHLEKPSKFNCFTVHFDSLSFIHTNSCTFSYNYVSVF